MRALHTIVTSAPSARGRRRRRAALAGPSLLTSALAFGACAPAPSRAPHALHPIAEARAADLVVRTFRDEGLEPEANRYLRVGKEKRLRVEIAAAGRKFGVAYLTPEDWQDFGDALPPHAQDDSLVVAPAEGGSRVLLLWASDYVEDDLANDAHNATTTAADLRLQRDVRDFLHRAEAQKWP